MNEPIPMQCCGCGCDLSFRLADFIDVEEDRRLQSIKEGFPWPICGVFCEGCEVQYKLL